MVAAKWIRAAEAVAKAPQPILTSRLDDHLMAARLRAVPVNRKPWLLPSPHDFPPASSLTVKGELKRFPPSSTVSLWSPLLDRLIGDGLIERVYDPEPPCLCLGFRLTAKGKAAR